MNKYEIDKLDFKNLYASEITCIRIKDDKLIDTFTNMPINITYNEHLNNTELRGEEPANLIIKDKGIVKYVVVNGFIYNLTNSTNSIYNGLVIN